MNTMYGVIPNVSTDRENLLKLLILSTELTTALGQCHSLPYLVQQAADELTEETAKMRQKYKQALNDFEGV